MRKISALLAFICCMALAAGDIFTVERAADGSFSVKHRGQLLLQNITALLGAGQDKLPLKEDYKVLADGSKVWNIWCEDFEASYRMEIVQLGNGKSVEISMLGEAPAWPKYSKRQITMQMPMEQFKNASFKGVVGLSRFGHIYKAGVFNDALDKGALLNQQWRFLAIDGGKDKQILLDFDPIGPTNCSPSYTTGVIYGMGRLNNHGS